MRPSPLQIISTRGWRFLLLVVLCCTMSSAIEESEFVEIPTPVAQGTVGITIERNCGGRRFQFPPTMFTIKPKLDDDTTVVKSFPQALVTATTKTIDKKEFLTILYNEANAPGAEQGGVLIEFPAAQLHHVQAHTSEQVQVLAGFTHVEALVADTSSSLTADCSTLTEGTLAVTVATSGSLTVASSIPIAGLSASTSASLTLGGNVTGTGNSVETSGSVSIKGDVMDSATTMDLSTSSQTLVDGNVGSGATITMGTSSSLTVTGQLQGQVKAGTSASVQASSCDQVTTEDASASCSSNSGDKTVTVNVDPQPLTLQGSSTWCSGAVVPMSTTMVGVVSLMLSSTAVGMLWL